MVVNDNNVTDNFTTVTFGSVTQGQGGPLRVFTVTNTGDDVLSLGQVSVPAGYILLDDLPSFAEPGRVATRSRCSSTRRWRATRKGRSVRRTRDADENPFNFAVTGTVTPPVPQFPEVTVSANGNNIPDNQNAAIVFGPTNQNANPPDITFLVTNDGNDTLNLTGLAVPPGFTVVDGLSGSLAPGGSTRSRCGWTRGRWGRSPGTSRSTTTTPTRTRSTSR